MRNKMNEDFYQILGIQKRASKEEIKKAYRNLARELHPDRNKNNKEAEEKFKRVSAAYAVLGDEEKRKIYDQYGVDGLRDGFDPNLWNKFGGFSGGSGGAHGNGGFDFGGFEGFGAMEDIFENLFGRNRRKTHQRWQTQEKGKKIETQLEVELMDVILGRELQVIVPIEGEKRRLKVKIPQGIEDGKKIRLKEQGGRKIYGGRNGDLYLEIKIKKDRIYERKGEDLYKKEEFTIGEAYNGVVKEIDTPWGKGKINLPEGTQGGSKLRLKGKGMKNSKMSGDLYIFVAIKIPKNKEKRTDAAIAEIEKCY